MASSPPSPGPLSSESRIPRLPTGSHTPPPWRAPHPRRAHDAAIPPASPGRVAVAAEAQSVGGAVLSVPVPLPWAAVAVPPPGREGPFVAQAGPAATSEAARRSLSLLLPPRPGGLADGPPNSVWTGGRATQSGGGSAVGTGEDTSDPIAPRRVAAFAATGVRAAFPEPRQVARIRPRVAGAIEARNTRALKKAR